MTNGQLALEESGGPTVSVLIPTYQEEAAIDRCLDAIAAQTYPAIVEILVIDGRSTDATRALAAAHTGVRVLDNPDRIQSAALNTGIEAARGEVLVRADGHCVIADDYVARCVAALEATGAAMVGGAMTPVAAGAAQEGIAAAMGSRVGAGPARFHTGATRGGSTPCTSGPTAARSCGPLVATPPISTSTRMPSWPTAWGPTAVCGSTRRSARPTPRAARSVPWRGSSTATDGAEPAPRSATPIR